MKIKIEWFRSNSYEFVARLLISCDCHGVFVADYEKNRQNDTETTLICPYCSKVIKFNND